jgi:antirestriction protein ArdC
MPKFDIYQSVTDSILEALERGVPPWRSPLLAQPSSLPMSLAARQAYRGINVFLLAMRSWAEGYESNYWLTFKQCQKLGGQVRKGEKTTLVVFWKLLEKVEDGEKKKIPVLRYYRVFNAMQCGGLPEQLVPDAPRRTEEDFDPIQAAEAILDGYPTARRIRRVGPQPCYRPLLDELMMPEPEKFFSAIDYMRRTFMN